MSGCELIREINDNFHYGAQIWGVVVTHQSFHDASFIEIYIKN